MARGARRLLSVGCRRRRDGSGSAPPAPPPRVNRNTNVFSGRRPRPRTAIRTVSVFLLLARRRSFFCSRMQVAVHAAAARPVAGPAAIASWLIMKAAVDAAMNVKSIEASAFGAGGAAVRQRGYAGIPLPSPTRPGQRAGTAR